MIMNIFHFVELKEVDALMGFTCLNENYLQDGEACLFLGPDRLRRPDPTQNEILNISKIWSTRSLPYQFDLTVFALRMWTVPHVGRYTADSHLPRYDGQCRSTRMTQPAPSRMTRSSFLNHDPHHATKSFRSISCSPTSLQPMPR